MSDPFLSIVIPAYNEALRIGTTLEKVRQYLDSRNFACELIIVDDGSRDETPEILERFQERHPGVRVLRNEPNCGKGFTVRRGVLAARGEYVLFTDADLSAPIEETNKLLGALESTGADAAVGSRALNRRLIGIHQPWSREMGGRVFNLLVRILTGLSIHDTQCGLKLFRRASTERAFELQRVTGFGFDPEVLFLIERIGGRIVEVPVRWNNVEGTKVSIWSGLDGFVDLWRIRRNDWAGKYR